MRKLTMLDFWARIEVNDAGCWIWHGAINDSGYGMWSRHDRVHRMTYEMLKGPIPEGLQIDHLCRVRRCVNPAHLEAVTVRENLLRGETITARNAATTHCPTGHPYSGTNLIKRAGLRLCRDCTRAQAARKYAEVAALGRQLGYGAKEWWDMPSSQRREAGVKSHL